MVSITQEALSLAEAGIPVQSFTLGTNAEELGRSGDRMILRIDREHHVATAGDIVRIERRGYAMTTSYMGRVTKAELAGKTYDIILTVLLEDA